MDAIKAVLVVSVKKAPNGDFWALLKGKVQVLREDFDNTTRAGHCAGHRQVGAHLAVTVCRTGVDSGVFDW